MLPAAQTVQTARAHHAVLVNAADGEPGRARRDEQRHGHADAGVAHLPPRYRIDRIGLVGGLCRVPVCTWGTYVPVASC